MKTLTLLLGFAVMAPAQVASDANRHYADRESRRQMVKVLADPARADRLQAEKLVGALGLRVGDTVVDLGTGAGVLLPYLAEAVGPAGQVLAQDIHEDFLEAARRTASEARLANVDFALGGERDPNLPANSADMILAVDAYHHFDYPKPLLARVHNALKSAGRLAIMDYYKHGFRDPDHIRADKPVVIEEIEAAGFRLVKDIEHVPDTQYLLIFEKAD